MQKRYFTFLYVPGENTGLKTLRIPKWLVYSLFSVVGLLMVSSGVAVIKYASKIGDTYRVTVLDKENEVLREQVSGFEQKFTNLERQVQQNFDFQKKARILANLDDLSEDVAQVGVGGPDAGYLHSLSILDPEMRGNLSTLRDDMDKLMRQARLQTDTYGDILKVLTDNQKRRNATPSIKPLTRGYVSSRFGRRMHPLTGRSSWHYGVDYSARLGTPILASADGIVTFSGRWHSFGLSVEISHGFDYVTRYAHCSKLLVKKGQRIRRGDVIARVGSTGSSTATHLHYEVIDKGKKKNPLKFVLSGKEITD